MALEMLIARQKYEKNVEIPLKETTPGLILVKYLSGEL